MCALIYTSREASARELMIEAHAGQVDSDGKPHTVHCLAVASLVKPEHRVVALLHDVHEDSPEHWTQVTALTTPTEARALWLLTRRSTETYAQHIDGIVFATFEGGESGAIAIDVKRADLMHNLSRCLTDVADGVATEKTHGMIKRYQKALVTILQHT